MNLFDSHTHLESPRFEPDREKVIARAVSAGVMRVVSCGSDLASSRVEVALAQEYGALYAAVGIHPHQATSATLGESAKGRGEELDERVFAQLAELAARPEAVAIGEIGLDYHYDLSPRKLQRPVLRRQLDLACELDLPVILHNRESDEDMRDLVDRSPSSLRGVLHCFLSDQVRAHWALSRGLHIGIAGPITFSNANRLAAIVRHIALDRLLVETDSPYLAPRPKRGKRNEPAFVIHVAQKLAELLDISVGELAHHTTENACRLFGVD